MNEKDQQRLHRLLQMVEWPCGYCGADNETSRLLWLSLRYGLYCRECCYAQNYLEHIAQFDPEPPRHLREQREQQEAGT